MSELESKRSDFVKEIWSNSKTFAENNGADAPQYVEVDTIFEIVKKYKDKEIDRLNNIIKQIKELCDKYDLGKYDYSVPVFELKEVIKSE